MATKVTILSTQFAKHNLELDKEDMKANAKEANAFLKKKKVAAVVTKFEVAAGGKAVTLTVDVDDPTEVKAAFK